LTLLKIIVLCLALANAGYFLWSHGIAAKAPVVAAPATTLKLASEVPGSKAPAADGGGLSGLDGAAAPDAAAGAAVIPAAPEVAGGTPELLTNVKRCVTVGPFRDVSEAAHAASTLRSAHYDPRQRVVDGEVWAGVWVYLPIPVGRTASEQMLAKLKAAGIDDAMEMPGPIDGSVISLGLYGDQKRAQARVTQAQALGFIPTLADRKRAGNVYWIDIDLKPTDGLLNPSDLQGESGRISRLEVKACPSTAAPP
jgi:hypothetical protein